VTSAPLVQSEIAGGRAMITLGAPRDPADLAAEARDLVVTLRAGARPSPLVLARESIIPASR
jgi:preprotein translocase subunit SecD